MDYTWTIDMSATRLGHMHLLSFQPGGGVVANEKFFFVEREALEELTFGHVMIGTGQVRVSLTRR